jgi:hypothetical protein
LCWIGRETLFSMAETHQSQPNGDVPTMDGIPITFRGYQDEMYEKSLTRNVIVTVRDGSHRLKTLTSGRWTRGAARLLCLFLDRRSKS